MTRRGGVVVLTGFAEDVVEVPVTDLIRTGRTLRGNLMGMGSFRDTYPKLVSFYQEGKLMLDQLVSRTFGLGDVSLAFEAFEQDDVARSVLVTA
jgi:S-(hydroxymethyl)glutathione dehydrogenase/alcohol dehydrogenase